LAERLQIASGVFWTVDSDGVLLAGGTGCERRLRDLEAAAWDLIARDNSVDRAAWKLAAIGRIPEAAARPALARWLRDWAAAGWLERSGGNG
jgi:hypothetical protein